MPGSEEPEEAPERGQEEEEAASSQEGEPQEAEGQSEAESEESDEEGEPLRAQSAIHKTCRHHAAARPLGLPSLAIHHAQFEPTISDGR